MGKREGTKSDNVPTWPPPIKVTDFEQNSPYPRLIVQPFVSGIALGCVSYTALAVIFNVWFTEQTSAGTIILPPALGHILYYAGFFVFALPSLTVCAIYRRHRPFASGIIIGNGLGLLLWLALIDVFLHVALLPQ